MSKNTNLSFLTDYITADITNGRIGINNASPAYAFDVTGIARTSTSTYLATASGNVGIGTTSPATTLEVAGSVRAYLNSATQTELFAENSVVKIRLIASTSSSFISTSTNHPMIFETNNTERMRITSAGKVGIGLTAPGGKLDVQDTGTVAPANGQPGTGFNVRRSDGVLGVAIGYNDDPSTFYIQSNRMDGGVGIAYNLALSPVRGNVLIATYTDNGYKLYVNGNAAGPSGFANVSDRRLKKDITPIESALNKVKLLNGVSFNWDKTLRPDLALDDKNHLGLIAQDVEEILPQVVTTGIDELKTKTITYSDIVPVLIEAIKELSAKVSLLENK